MTPHGTPGPVTPPPAYADIYAQVGRVTHCISMDMFISDVCI